MIQQLLHEVRELRQKQEELEREIERQRAARQVVSKDGVAVVPENVVVGGERPRTFVLPGTNTEVRIGGYVKGDLIYDIDSDVGDTFDVGAIPPKLDVTEDGDLVPNPEALREGRFGGHARESRLNIATWTPSPFGEIHTFLEGDFFGAGGNEVISNSRGLRLRHAYGEIGPLLVGQTWTTFMHPAGLANTLDFQGSTGLSFIRQGLVRWTQEVTPELSFAVALENSELTGRGINPVTGAPIVLGSRSTGTVFAGAQFGIDTYPDVVGAVMYNDGRYINAKLAGVVRGLEVDRTDLGVKDSTTGWGVQGSAAIHPFADDPRFGRDTLRLNAAWGDGIGRYLINGATQDAFLTAAGTLETIEAWGVAVSYTHHWLDNLRSTLAWGHQEFEDTFALTDTKRLDSVHANLIWSPWERVELGAELMWGRRAFVNPILDNEAKRVQVSGKFDF